MGLGKGKARRVRKDKRAEPVLWPIPANDIEIPPSDTNLLLRSECVPESAEAGRGQPALLHQETPAAGLPCTSESRRNNWLIHLASLHSLHPAVIPGLLLREASSPRRGWLWLWPGWSPHCVSDQSYWSPLMEPASSILPPPRHAPQPAHTNTTTSISHSRTWLEGFTDMDSSASCRCSLIPGIELTSTRD